MMMITGRATHPLQVYCRFRLIQGHSLLFEQSYEHTLQYSKQVNQGKVSRNTHSRNILENIFQTKVSEKRQFAVCSIQIIYISRCVCV